MTDKIQIELDGRLCEANPGEMIIAVADREGVAIPRFCYHSKLSIAANCRMCLVEAEQGGRPFPKPVPACATPVGDGMKVQTRSKLALEAQRGTMEFLLINHPLDCPICDQGGECELQDVSMGYGEDVSRFSERKRVVKDEDLGPLIATEMTRCIHCTRCVRFGAEIAGVRELGATGRGEDMRIGTFVGQTVAHELSGNVIDLCPVGALTSKPYRFTGRAWELTSEDSIAPHDGLGSNLHVHVRNGRVMRVHPRDNEAVNETWISDRDRFSYQGLHSETRLTDPMVKDDQGIWREVPWQQVLGQVADALKNVDADQLGCLISPSATLEEQFLAQKLIRALGGKHIDSRLRQQDFSGDAADPRAPWLGLPVADLERQQAALVVGSDLRQEQPLLAHRLRKAALDGADIGFINPYELDLTHPSRQLIAEQGDLVAELLALAKVAGITAIGAGLDDRLTGIEPNATHEALVASLRDAEEPSATILLGALAEAHPAYAQIKLLAVRLAETLGCRLGLLPAAGNSVGAALAGALPHREAGAKAIAKPGLNALAMLREPRQRYLLWGIDPGHDLIDPALAYRALSQSDLVIACSAFRTPSLEALADVLLPIGAFTETAGTFVNANGDWQRFQGLVAPLGEARPGWKVLRVLGNLLGLPGFEQTSARQVHDEVQALCASVSPSNVPLGDYTECEHTEPGSSDQVVAESVTDPNPSLIRIGNLPIYAVDALVRAAPALQHTPLADHFAAHLHPAQAASMGLDEGDEVALIQDGAEVRLPVRLDDRIATGCVRVPAGVAGSEMLGAQIGPIRLAKTGATS